MADSEDARMAAELYVRAKELLEIGETERAHEALERVLELVPDHADAAAMLQRTGRQSLIRWLRR
jgi:tetratricopeptide (TPR) repeat protein